MNSRFEKVPISWWRWMIAIIAILLVGGATAYFSHSVLLTIVFSFVALIFLWIFWLAQRSFKCRVCGSWIRISDEFGLGPVSLSCCTCYSTVVYVP